MRFAGWGYRECGRNHGVTPAPENRRNTLIYISLVHRDTGGLAPPLCPDRHGQGDANDNKKLAWLTSLSALLDDKGFFAELANPIHHQFAVAALVSPDQFVKRPPPQPTRTSEGEQPTRTSEGDDIITQHV